MLCVGVDFGTSNSSAAVYDGRIIHLLPLDPEAFDPCVMRSFVYIERSGTVWFGHNALSRYLEQNTGRAVLCFPKTHHTLRFRHKPQP